MRLYEDESKVLDLVLRDIKGDVYLFGSRVDDTKKGGDIDILIYSQENSLKLSQQISREFRMELDSKLDVLVLDKFNMTKEQKIFVDTLDMVRIK